MEKMHESYNFEAPTRTDTHNPKMKVYENEEKSQQEQTNVSIAIFHIAVRRILLIFSPKLFTYRCSLFMFNQEIATPSYDSIDFMLDFCFCCVSFGICLHRFDKIT